MRFLDATLAADSHWRNTCGAGWAIVKFGEGILRTFFMGRKDRVFLLKTESGKQFSSV